MPEEIRPNAAYSVAQVAELLGYDVHGIYGAIRRKELRSWMPNGCKQGLRVLGRWVLEWMGEGNEQE